MFLIAFKKYDENEEFIFEKAMTFTEANDMVTETISKLTAMGRSMKVGYRIIDFNSLENLFNSRANIDANTESLFSIIKQNNSLPKEISDYIIKIENGEVEEPDDEIIFDDSEQRAKLADIKIQQNALLQNFQEQEKARKLRELEHEREIDRLKEETKKLEASNELKEKQEEVKEAERLQMIQELQKQKEKAEQIAFEKRKEDQKKKEEHENQLRELDDERKKAEFDLTSIQKENEKKDLERKTEIQRILDKKNAAKMQSELLNVEDEKKNAEHQSELIKHKPESNTPVYANLENLPTFESDKSKRINFKATLKTLSKGISYGASKVRALWVEYKESKAKNRELREKELEQKQQIEMAKIQFLNELRKDKQEQDKLMEKEQKKKVKEALSKERIERKFVKGMKKWKPSRKGLSLKNVIVLAIIIGGSIYLYDFYTNNNGEFPEVINRIINVIKQGKEKIF